MLDKYSGSKVPYSSMCQYGLFDAIGGIIGKMFDYGSNTQTNKTNRSIAQDNLEYQAERNQIEDERYEDERDYNRAFAEDERDYSRSFAEDERDYQRAFAEEERSYNRALQQQLFEREDTALERQASSLSAMGINPLSQQLNGLGAGSPVTSSAPSSVSSPSTPSAVGSSRGGQALNNQYQMQAFQFGTLAPLGDLLNSFDQMESRGVERDSLRQQQNIDRLIAQEKAIENLILADKNNIGFDENGNPVLKSSFKHKEQDFNEANFVDKNATAERNERENKYQKEWDVTDNTSKNVRSGTDISARFATESEKQKELTSNSPLAKTKDSLTQSAKIVGNSLQNTVGKGFKYLWNNTKKKAAAAKSWLKNHTMNADELQNAYGF